MASNGPRHAVVKAQLVEPGSPKETLARRRPRGVWHLTLTCGHTVTRDATVRTRSKPVTAVCDRCGQGAL